MHDEHMKCLKWLGLDGTASTKLIKNEKGYGIAAKKNLKKGTVIAAINNSHIITYQKALHSKLGQKIHAIDGVTKEMLLWYYMCEEATINGHFAIYLKNSLKSYDSCLLMWGESRLGDLAGTNLLQHVITTKEQLIIKYNILMKAYPNPNINEELFFWVYSIYVSRRYPHDLCKDESIGAITTNQSQESNMSNLGIMVPFLDLINHNQEKEWLLLTPTPESLLIIINVDVKKGDEIYSNYGHILSNQKLLYTYGFAIPRNIHDSISVNLYNSSRDHVGTFEIRRGGIAGCSADMWKVLHELYGDNECRNVDVTEEVPIVHIESCEILLEYIVNKYEQLLTLNPIAAECRNSTRKKKQKLNDEDGRRTYIKYFIEGQLEVMEDLLTDLNNIVEENVQN